MANLYTFFDNGTWEASPADAANQNPSYFGVPGNPPYFGKSADVAHSGAFSGKCSPDNGVYMITPSLAYLATFKSYSPRSLGFLTVGTKYKMEFWLFTPSGNPLGTDDMPVTVLATGPGAQNNANVISTVITISDCKDNWVKISVEFIYQTYLDGLILVFYPLTTTSAPGGPTTPSNSSKTPIDYGGTHIVPAGTAYRFGAIYIDDITFDEAIVCDLAFGSPAYTKTDETGVGLNDGTITVNATTTHGPLQYSIDGGAYQPGNVFAGVDPGPHTITVKDAGSCSPISTTVNINAFVPPAPPNPNLIIDEEPVNHYNFISWFDANGEIGFNNISCVNPNWDLPTPYRRQNVNQRHYAVIAQAEDFSFYINFDVATNRADFPDMKIALVNQRGAIVLDQGVLKQDMFPDNEHYNIYATLNLGARAPGKYYFLIYNSSTGEAIWFSSGIQVMSIDDAKYYTIRIRHRNSQDIYNYFYTRVPNFLNEVRLQFNRTDEQTEGTLTQYRGVSNGKLRNVSFDLDLWVQLEVYFFDDNAIRGMYEFQACDAIDINGKNYILKETFKANWNPKRKTNKGVISVYEQQFSTQNRYGKNLTILGTDDPLILGNEGFIKI